MKIVFLHGGESPEFGPFRAGQETDLIEEKALVLIERGVAEKAKSPAKAAKKEEKDV